jgi:endonuclease I
MFFATLIKAKWLASVTLILCHFFSYGQIPAGYYDAASGLYGTQLQQALHNIIKDHEPRTYAQLWSDFSLTDRKPNDKVWDMYSYNPQGSQPYEYDFFTDQCGSYNSEADCYNREHSFPASWFNDGYPMYSDLFHLVPTDGYVNNKRGNLPYGEVGSASWTSANGSKVGTSSTTGYGGNVFEPIDEFKGDFARNMLYMAVRYYNQDNSWPGSDMTNGAEPKSWARKMLLVWHISDPVSNKEISRNNTIFSLQQNRNPFIDRPEFAEMIWGEDAGTGEKQSALSLKVYPNPAIDFFRFDLSVNPSENIAGTLIITGTEGRLIQTVNFSESSGYCRLSPEMKPGMYMLQFTDNQGKVFRGLLLKSAR